MTLTPTPSGRLKIIEHVPFPNPVLNEDKINIYLLLVDIPESLSLKIYTTAGRFIRGFDVDGISTSPDLKIVYEGPAARYAYTFNFDLTDRNADPLANGLYYYVLKATKKEVGVKVYGKFGVLH